jgi:RNA polymerase sigma factor (sigma-70 family)
MEATALPRAHGGARSPRLLRLAGDDHLVELVRRGNEAAFEAIYDRHHRPILSFCRHMLAGRDDAEDAVQHTFLSAYRDLTTSDKAIELRPWLFTIARNRCLSMLRARREQAGIEDLEPATEGLAAEVQQREDLRELLGDLRRLPDEQRAALVLSELGALGHDEIAQVLDCPKDKVKALVFQARSSLQASKQARETPCEQIREELATRRGGALRRSHLRRHLRDCSGCREFRSEVERQRKAIAAVLPVVPTVALKQGVLAGALGGAAGGAGGGLLAGGLGVVATKGLAAKAVAVLAVAGAGTAGTVAVVDELEERGRSSDSRGAPTRVVNQGAAVAGGDLAAQTVVPGAQRGNGAAPPNAPPGTPGSGGNRERAHQLALSRGNGRKRGLNSTQPGLTNSGDGPGNSQNAPGQNREPGSTGNSGGNAGAQGLGGGSRPQSLPEPAVPVAPGAPPVTLPPQARAPGVPGS